MTRFIAAHGYDAGPTQRPLLAGLLTAAISELPAAALLWRTGTFASIASVTGVDVRELLLAHVAMVLERFHFGRSV
jgi:hypothetical protein